PPSQAASHRSRAHADRRTIHGRYRDRARRPPAARPGPRGPGTRASGGRCLALLAGDAAAGGGGVPGYPDRDGQVTAPLRARRDANQRNGRTRHGPGDRRRRTGMASRRRFEQDVPALLADLYLAGTPDYRDDLVRQVRAVRQRPAWSLPGRWLPMEITSARVPITRLNMRQLGLLPLIAILVAALFPAYIGSLQPKLPPPFGVARNGAMLYGSGGDIYQLDPITGVSTALV